MKKNAKLENPATRDKQVNLTNKIKQCEEVNHILAHNLRGAAANIQMLAKILIRKKITEANSGNITEDDVFTAGEAIQYIHESSASLSNTLNTLLEAAHIQLNESIEFDDCDIASIVEHITNQLNGFIHQQKAVVEFNLKIAHISYPRHYMQSILYNFINNALKYSRHNVPPKIIISTYTQDGKIVLTVKDNGRGIDLEGYGKSMFKLSQVFHLGLKSKGIGLYITKTQIESLGGSISLKSKPGEGSEFMVTF